jgi:predicted metal-dependent phosphoesterase TrpH
LKGADARRAGATVDLHLHSTASDGLLAPAAVVAAARSVGLVAIALTDHDTVDGVREARQAAERDGIRMVAGIELSAEEDTDEVHVIGLHLEDLDRLSESLRELREARVVRARVIVDRLRELGAVISFDAVMGYSAGGAVGRPHVARALIDAGLARDFRDAFDRYLGIGRPAYVPKRRLSAAEAIQLVHSSGGLAFWAHPGECGSEQRVRALVEVGLDGLEVLHPSHSADEVPRLSALCEAIQLLPTGGSDWHATPGTTRSLGNQAVPLSWLERHDAALSARASSGSRP